ncbi:MAG TPA: hypothetical protein VNX21_08790 [Candidatus Thermoplasmatota archaeon]|nr:hypothetical protein [Candidatus Thermoplasmatota archaeon]
MRFVPLLCLPLLLLAPGPAASLAEPCADLGTGAPDPADRLAGCPVELLVTGDHHGYVLVPPAGWTCGLAPLPVGLVNEVLVACDAPVGALACSWVGVEAWAYDARVVDADVACGALAAACSAPAGGVLCWDRESGQGGASRVTCHVHFHGPGYARCAWW